jgi:uncharacterized protein (TIGR03118 family)
VVALAALASSVALAGPAAADGRGHRSRYVETDLVSDMPGRAQVTDPNLVNAWGLSAGPTTPVWVSDNGTDVSTLYRGATTPTDPVAVVPLVVSIPGGAPTGTVFNDGDGFVVGTDPATAPARFLFASEAGVISGWNPNVPAASSTAAQVGATTPDAVYKGLAIADSPSGRRLYAANFHAGTIDVFDDAFKPVDAPGGFTDRAIPAGYAPFNVQELDGLLYVTYAQQDADAHDDVPGRGHGFIDIFDTDGHLLRRLARHGRLDSPWGLAIAPDGFGRLSGALLVGNFGDGHINAYDPWTGQFLGQVRGPDGRPIVIDGLWALRFGNGVAGSAQTLLFTAGPDDEQHGLFGTITTSDDGQDGSGQQQGHPGDQQGQAGSDQGQTPSTMPSTTMPSTMPSTTTQPGQAGQQEQSQPAMPQY